MLLHRTSKNKAILASCNSVMEGQMEGPIFDFVEDITCSYLERFQKLHSLVLSDNALDLFVIAKCFENENSGCCVIAQLWQHSKVD